MSKATTPSNRLLVDEALCDDNSVVSLPKETMQKLQLSHGDTVLIQGKRSRQAVSIAMAYDTCECDIEPKIRLNRDVMNDLCVRIGDFVSLHCPDDAKRNKPLQILTTYDKNSKNSTEFLTHLPDDYHCSQPFSLLFVRFEHYFLEPPHEGDDDPHYFEPFCQFFCEKSKTRHGKIPSYYLSFLPCPVTIIASFDDLVVATSLEHTIMEDDKNPDYDIVVGATVNYICNPLTKQWVMLPKVIPPFNNSGYGLIREPSTSFNARYRLVMIGRAHSDSDFDRWRQHGDYTAIRHCKGNEFVAKVFCSEIGEWSEYVISYPQPEKYRKFSPRSNLDMVGSNGVLYWLEGQPLFKGVVAFDPFNDIYTGQCRFIPLPALCFKNTEWSTKQKVCLGVVKGQLRLSQIYEANSYYVFRVWELKNSDTESPSWRLVYNLKLNCSGRRVYVLSFHPNSTNLIFMLCGNDICQYDIFEKKYEKIGEYLDEWDYEGIKYISTFTLLYPTCPTQIPTIPAAESGIYFTGKRMQDIRLL